jgi:hypothetical protein
MVLSVVALVIPFTSAFAASGWQYKGFYYRGVNGSTPIFTSGGGYIKICAEVANPSQQGKEDLTLYEYDPGSGNDKKIGSTKYLSDGECTTYYVQNYVDGDNHKAELYFTSNDSGDVGVDVWD